jgi:pyruvate kinase
MDDGKLEVVVREVMEDHLVAEVVLGGILKSNKGVNLPGAPINIPGFTEDDEADLVFGLALGIDAVAISFVRSAHDIQMVRDAIQRHAPQRSSVAIIAKLERPEALDNLEEILRVTDGVMVARGDLGVEMPPETVPIAQKRIIEAANRHARIVITATQMLDSMIESPRPTRAEASDVANAIFDGSDAVMLSGETASGKYPLQSVQMMNAIICQAEAHMEEWGHFENMRMEDHTGDDTFYVTQAARELAHDRNVEAIAVFTRSGRTALLMSKRRPRVPILAFTSESETYSRMNLYWGVHAHLVPHVETIEGMLAVVEAAMISSTMIQTGNQVVLICGFPIHAIRATNLALLHTVGQAS